METNRKTFWFDKLDQNLDVLLLNANERRIVIKDLNLRNEKVLIEVKHTETNTALIFNQSIDYKVIYLNEDLRMTEQTTAVNNENGQVIITYHKWIMLIPLKEFYEIEKNLRTREVGRKFLEELEAMGPDHSDVGKVSVTIPYRRTISL